ncbi:MAG: hypothetical protein ACTSYI_11985 [Promethearchaeota archaeon]
MALQTLTKRALSKVSNKQYCDTMDEMYAIYDDNGYRIGDSKQKSPVNVVIHHPSTRAHAESIVEIYKEIYQGTYPFHEMLDPDFLVKTFTDPDYYWGIFCPPKDTDTIMGCFTVVIDRYHNAGYMRGLNILPKYRKQIGVRELSYAMVKRFFVAHPEVNKWYNEARTAHSIVQHLSRVIAAKIQAIFLNKDYFMHQKESDALMVGYWESALEARVIPEKILPEVIPFYLRSRTMHDFAEDIPSVESCPLKIDKEKLRTALSKIQFSHETDKYGYIEFRFHDPDTHEFLTGLYTPTVRNIEKIRYQVNTLEKFMGFCIMLQFFADQHRVEYIEFQIPVSELAHQRYLLENQLIIAGYVPAWLPTKQNTQNKENKEDAVVLVWTDRLPELDSLQLIEEGHELLDLIAVSSRLRPIEENIPVFSPVM